MNKGSGTGFFSGLVVGGMVGALVALMYAPQPGPETRRLLKEKAMTFKEKAQKALSNKAKASPGSSPKKKRPRKPIDRRRRLL